MNSAQGNDLVFRGEKDLPPRAFTEAVLREAVTKINCGVSQTLTARLATEKPPSDPRHLTDTRTRVSTLLEYSLAYEVNQVLLKDGAGLSVSAVLWNVFPDLIVRNRKREDVVGLEIKALHTAAEEKSANFMTPLQYVRRNRDFIVIITWGWQSSEVEGAPIVYPHVHTVGVFDAWLLAKIRDYGWLLSQNGRRKGIDLATPIISGATGHYKAEEGNLGKLMRISMPSDMPVSVPHYEEMKAEDSNYSAFKQQILALGLTETFREIAVTEGMANVEIMPTDGYPESCRVLGSATAQVGQGVLFLAGSRPEAFLRDNPDLKKSSSYVFWLGSKLDWKLFRKGEDSIWRVSGSGAKPDTAQAEIAAAFKD